MSSDAQKLVVFVHRLFEKTRSGEAPWEAGSDPNVLGLSFPSHTVTMERVPPSSDGPEDFGLRITNAESVPVAQISAFELNTLGFDKMREFFDTARHIALHLDEALDTLSEELESLRFSRVRPLVTRTSAFRPILEIPPEGMNFEQFERDLILQAMDKSNWVIAKASKMLGMSYRTLQYRLDKFGLKAPDSKPGPVEGERT